MIKGSTKVTSLLYVENLRLTMASGSTATLGTLLLPHRSDGESRGARDLMGQAKSKDSLKTT